MLKIDKTSDYHMHTQYSDGCASIDEMAISAIEKGLSQITITDHMPLPFDTRYTMNKHMVDQYKLALRQAQSKFSGKLKINMGIELEFVPEYRFWVHSISKMGWDYTIASVHRLSINGYSQLVNGTIDEFKSLFKHFDYDIRALYRVYYKTLQEALSTGWFDIAAHLDVIKKHNVDSTYFNEADPYYRALVVKTLDIIKEQGMKMEINTSGFNHPIKEQYPSHWIIQEAQNKGIPIVLSSDSHSPDTLGQYFHKTDALFKNKIAV